MRADYNGILHARRQDRHQLSVFKNEWRISLSLFKICCVPMTGWSRPLGVKFHDIIYRTFRHILYTLVSSKAAQSRSTAVDRDLSGSISAISVRR